jgi:hypothetical protein
MDLDTVFPRSTSYLFHTVRIFENRDQLLHEVLDPIYILDHHAVIAVDQFECIRQLLDDFVRTDQTSPARQYFPRDDRIMKFDRKILLKAADRDASSNELWNTPVRKEWQLAHASF